MGVQGSGTEQDPITFTNETGMTAEMFQAVPDRAYYTDPTGLVSQKIDRGVTFAEWQGMSRSEREALGLPVSKIGGERHFRRFFVGVGTQDPNERFNADGSVSSPDQERNLPPEAREQRRVYETLSEQGVDDTSIALLRSHGTDMLDYVLSVGAKSNEEVTIALSDWGKENGMVMPFDKSALVYALNTALN